jgi:hypothetical protein
MECAADDYASPRAQTGTDALISDEEMDRAERLARAWSDSETDFGEDPMQCLDGLMASIPILVSEVRRLRSAALRREEREPLRERIEALLTDWERTTSTLPPGHVCEPPILACARELRLALSSPATNPEPETKEG